MLFRSLLTNTKKGNKLGIILCLSEIMTFGPCSVSSLNGCHQEVEQPLEERTNKKSKAGGDVAAGES